MMWQSFMTCIYRLMISISVIAILPHTTTRTRAKPLAWWCAIVWGSYVAIVSHKDMKCRNVFGTIVVAVLAPSICANLTSDW